MPLCPALATYHVLGLFFIVLLMLALHHVLHVRGYVLAQ